MIKSRTDARFGEHHLEQQQTAEHAPGDASQFHAVMFYESPGSLCRIVAAFLGEGLTEQQPAVIIATPEHRHRILAELLDYVDVDEMQAAGDLLLLDADETLALFMVDGRPDATRFDAVVACAIARVRRRRRNCIIRAYGEMVNVLWKSGQDSAAIRLETLWSPLVMSRAFSLLCGYAMGNFYKDASLAHIHHEHSHAVSPKGLVTRLRRRTW